MHESAKNARLASPRSVCVSASARKSATPRLGSCSSSDFRATEARRGDARLMTHFGARARYHHFNGSPAVICLCFNAALQKSYIDKVFFGTIREKVPIIKSIANLMECPKER